MGSVLGIGQVMDDNMKKQQEFMLKTGAMQMERQLQMQNQMRERMMAMQIARARDMCMWFGSFYSLALLGCLAGMRRNRMMIAPMVPLTFIMAYQLDLSHGSKMQRMKAEADRIMDDEAVMLELPHGLPTFSSIESARLQQKDDEKINHGHDIFL